MKQRSQDVAFIGLSYATDFRVEASAALGSPVSRPDGFYIV
jgi:hypothetical protein